MASVRGRRPQLLAWSGWPLAILGPVLLTVVLNLAGGPRSREYAFLYLGLVAIMAVTFGLWPSLVAAIASFLLIDYYFVPPYYTFTIGSEEDLVNLVILLGAAGLVGGLGSMRRRAQLGSQALARQLTDVNRELERLNREQAEAARMALRLAVTEEQVKALEESDRARRDFLANVSHDLRTPTATILTETTSVLEDAALAPTARASLESVAGEAQRLNAIVADMLDMARIEGSALDLVLEPVSLNLALRAASERLQRASPRRQFILPPPDPTLFVLADWSRLGQVLDNLLSNADRAAPLGTTIDIEATADPSSAMATFRVRDQGPGIPPDLGDRVFERFVRGKRGGTTGLGLAIVKGLVEAHAGRVWIEPGSPGATIAVSLPLVEVVGEPAGPPSTTSG